MRLGPLLLLSGCLWISLAEHQRRTDRDGDGVGVDDDCDDRNPSVYPGNVETPCDAVDNDCAPATPDGPAANGAVTYATIALAIEAADPGDTLVLCPGRYGEPVVLPKSVTLTGSTTPDATVLDGSGLDGPVVTVTGGGATLRSLTVEGGTGGPNSRPDLVDGATLGGGVNGVAATGDVWLEDVVVTGNTADAGAGVVGPASSTLHLVRSVVRDNVATGLGGGVVATRVLLLEDSLVTGNAAQAGGGVYVPEAAEVTSVGASAVADNSAEDGGGAWLATGATWTGGTLSDNEADARGGGVYLDGGTLVGVLVDGNIAVSGGGGVAGGGVLDATDVDGNTAPAGGGVLVVDDLVLVASSVTGNQAQTGPGGGLLVVGGTLTASDDSVLVQGNSADASSGGGLAATTGSLDLFALSVLDNVALYGAGIALEAATCGTCAFQFTSVDLAGNEATTTGGGVWTDTSITLNACAFTSNEAAEGGGMYVAQGTTVVSGTTFTGNFAADWGGGIAIASTDGMSEVVGGVLEDNTAPEGAAILVGSGASLEVSGTDVRNSHYDGVGGAVSVLQGGSVPTTYASLSGTEYTGNGGVDVHVGGVQRDNDPDNQEFTCTWGDLVPAECVP